MSSDGPGDSDLDPAERFLAGLAEDRWGVRADGGRPTGRPVADADRRSHPDRGAATGRPQEGSRGPTRPRLDESCPVTPAIRAAASLREVYHVGPARSGRFGTERRVRHAASGDSRRVDVQVFRTPDGDEWGFADALSRQLHRWATVGAVDGVVPVHDCGRRDGPWVITASTGPPLGDRDTASVERTLDQAIHLAAALDALHERGVVHAGIDPGNVVFTLGGAGPSRPAFTRPGLVDVYRRYEDPASVLDPRYAAPEYFETDRGVVDRTTDVYGLGVLCFRLFTGVAPIEGSAEAIADRVTADDPLPRPSSVDPRIPAALDDVVLAATATDKFERFDTARAFHDALVAVRDGSAP